MVISKSYASAPWLIFNKIFIQIVGPWAYDGVEHFNEILFSIYFVAVALTNIQMDAQNRCTENLNPNGCVLADCGKKYFEKHNWKGLCSTSGTRNFICTCVYSCSLGGDYTT